MQEVARRIPECPVGQLSRPSISAIFVEKYFSRFALRSSKAAVRCSSVARDILSAGNVDLKFRLEYMFEYPEDSLFSPSDSNGPKK